MMKKIFCFVLTITLLMSLFSVITTASTVTVIKTPAQFIAIAKKPSGSYQLANDIDMSDTPLDKCIADDFSGKLDGKGFEIINLDITSTDSRVALFDTVSGKIENLTLRGSITVTSSLLSGVAVATVAVENKKGIIKDVASFVDVTVSAPQVSAAGIVAISNSKISLSSNQGVIECANYGKITVTRNSDYVGGILIAGGICAQANRVTGCINKGDVTVGNKFSSSALAAGIVSSIPNVQSEFKQNQNFAKVVSYATAESYAGGIACLTSKATNSIKESINRGNITANLTSENSDSFAEAGGILAHTTSCSILNCANYGKITAVTVAGGIVGRMSGGSVNLCFDKHSKTLNAQNIGPIYGYVDASSQKNTTNYYAENEKDDAYAVTPGTTHAVKKDNLSKKSSYPKLDFDKKWTFDSDVPTLNISDNTPDFTPEPEPSPPQQNENKPSTGNKPNNNTNNNNTNTKPNGNNNNTNTNTNNKPNNNTSNNNTNTKPSNKPNNSTNNNTSDTKKPVKKFKDVKKGAWYKEYVDYAVANGIFQGTSDKEFSPDMTMSRAQFVQVFANISGVNTDNTKVKTKFSDVKSGQWFTPAVKWASENGVVSGKGDGKFAPDEPVTREQMCVMIVNYVENYQKSSLKQTTKKANFKDDKKISSWAKTEVYKCQRAKLIDGIGNGLFAPQNTATRSVGATIFSDFHKSYIK